MAHSGSSERPSVDVRERGAERNGAPQTLDRRLFMQLLVYECDGRPQPLIDALGAALVKHKMPSVIYEDVNDPNGIGLLSWCVDPTEFTSKLRPAFAELTPGLLRPRRDF